jgi:hypothetical protein
MPSRNGSTAIKPILDGLEAGFSDDGISAADQAAMDANLVIWRATGQYLAQPLTDVWATAPYLPNWSVPTLGTWCIPISVARNSLWEIGENDPEKFGYATGGHGWTFDTSQPGDSNIGHASDEYGTNLTEDHKAALMVLEDQVTLGRQISSSSLDFRILRRETRT